MYIQKIVKKALIFAMCVLFLPIYTARADSGICFVAIDDTIPFELSSATMPFWDGGDLYVPSSVFENSSLGVYSSYDKTEWIYSLYNSNHRLDFYLTMMASYDSLGNYYEYKALTRNDRVFVPCSFVCAFFGLTYTYISEGTAYPIARITTGNQVYRSSLFAANASGIISSRAAAYLGGTVPQNNGQPIAENPEDKPEEAAGTNKSLALWLQVGQCDYVQQAAAALAENNISGTFFYTRQVAQSGQEDIRQLYLLGADIAVYGETTQELTAANDILDEVIYTRTRLSNAIDENSRAAGYIPFYWHIDANGFVSAPRTLNTGEELGSVVVLKIDLDRHNAESFTEFVDYLADSGYHIYALNETFECRS